MERPYLLPAPAGAAQRKLGGDRKFTLRLYVLFSSYAAGEKRLLLFRHGLLKKGGHPWRADDISDPKAELTNTELNLEVIEEDLDSLWQHIDTDTMVQNKIRSLKQESARGEGTHGKGGPWGNRSVSDWVWDRIRATATKHFASFDAPADCAASTLAREGGGEHSCFDVFGLDVMLTDKLEPVILEANQGPGMWIHDNGGVGHDETMAVDVFVKTLLVTQLAGWAATSATKGLPQRTTALEHLLAAEGTEAELRERHAVMSAHAAHLSALWDEARQLQDFDRIWPLTPLAQGQRVSGEGREMAGYSGYSSAGEGAMLRVLENEVLAAADKRNKAAERDAVATTGIFSMLHRRFTDSFDDGDEQGTRPRAHHRCCDLRQITISQSPRKSGADIHCARRPFTLRQIYNCDGDAATSYSAQLAHSFHPALGEQVAALPGWLQEALPYCLCGALCASILFCCCEEVVQDDKNFATNAADAMKKRSLHARRDLGMVLDDQSEQVSYLSEADWVKEFGAAGLPAMMERRGAVLQVRE